ncbi:MAG: hypothetical protein P1V35_01910 [Planctomycetota bacterium]|nr:hypothetical protein [Planctomycetota bacterium]
MQKLILPLVAAFGLAAISSAQTTISEIRIDQDGPDNDEFFELAGNPGASLDDLTYLVIGDATGAGSGGGIEAVVSLAGMSLDASGFFLVGQTSMTLANPGLTTNLSFENSDNVTHMLVRDFTGSNGDDLDLDDDGTMDFTPWASLLDSVALVESTGSGELTYGLAQVGPDGSQVPFHVSKESGVWKISDKTIGYGDTPGAPNNHPSTGTTFCDPGFVNSTGSPTVLSGFMGSGVGSDLHLQCTGGPMGEVGFFLAGRSAFDPGVVTSLGNFCLIGQAGDAYYRFNQVGGAANSVGAFDATGMLQNLVGTSGPSPGMSSGFDVPAGIPDVAPIPILAGDTWHFQVWHRDTPAGLGSSNFSNGLTVTF